MGPFLDFLSRDGRIILLNRTLRGLTYGFVSVLLAVYLQLLQASETTIGVVMGIALGSGAALNILASRYADRIGRRRFLALSGVLMAASGVILVTTRSIEGMIAAALLGALTPTAMEVGPFLSVEQAMLPQASAATGRTDAYAWYNLLGSLGAAVGALLSGLATPIANALGGDPITGIHVMFLGYAGAGVAASALSLALTKAVEPDDGEPDGTRPTFSPETRASVSKLVGLFAVDSFAGGMVIRTFTAFWFVIRFSPSLETLGLVFFGANTLSAMSYLVAARLTRRFGLVRTMVYTHIPSNVLLIALPFADTFAAGVALFLARLSIAQMDVAPRQEFVVSIVAPQERTAAAAVTNTSRNIAQAGGPFAIGPVTAAFAAAGPVIAVGSPFIVSGVLKLAYDLSLLRAFGGAAIQEDPGIGPAD